MKQVKTTSIGRGIEYAQVKDRLKAFHESGKAGNIETHFQETMGGMLVTAKIGHGDNTYTGHSFGNPTRESKALEKLETVAVGRALAFAGYSIDGAIASADEMEDFKEDQPASVRQEQMIDSLLQSSSLSLEKTEEIEDEIREGLTSDRASALIEYLIENQSNPVHRGNPNQTEIRAAVEDKLNDPKA